ncbi:MAG: hypothetical protein II430_00180, partial [Selenomonas sp.]|nr:hypothetical protein [Selenomonas sp.]
LENFQSFAAPHNCLPFKAVSAVCLPCLAATCIMLHGLYLPVNTLFTKKIKKIVKPINLAV